MDASAVVIPPYVAGPFCLEPFRALSLDPGRVGDPATARLYTRPYRAVAARLASWRERGDLTEDATAALYIHEYSYSGLTVTGIVGALDVTRAAESPADAAVLPHEGVHPEQVLELADRMLEMEVDPAPILLVMDYPAAARDVVAAVQARRPDHEFTDRGGQQHRVWRLQDATRIADLNASWRHRRALIADGHHRYAAYLRARAIAPRPGCERGLAMVVDQRTNPLHLGAIHRSLGGVTLADLRAAAEALDVAWHPAPHGEAVAALAADTLVLTDGREWASADLRLTEEHTAVEFLHLKYLPALPNAPARVRYHHTVDEALKHLRARREVAVLLPAPTLEQVWGTVAEGHLLPEKATSFQPKPHPGVLIRSLRA